MVHKCPLIVWICLTLVLPFDLYPLLPRVLAKTTGEYPPILSIVDEYQADLNKYIIQSETPVWLPNFAHPDRGCNWMGVAGQVFDRDTNPRTSLVIEVGGSLDGNQVNYLTLAGLAQEYGLGGYEIVLEDRVLDSTQELWIQIHDLSGEVVSEKYFFNTFGDCERNLVLINFVERQTSGEIRDWFFPMIYNSSTFFAND